MRKAIAVCAVALVSCGGGGGSGGGSSSQTTPAASVADIRGLWRGEARSPAGGVAAITAVISNDGSLYSFVQQTAPREFSSWQGTAPRFADRNAQYYASNYSHEAVGINADLPRPPGVMRGGVALMLSVDPGSRLSGTYQVESDPNAGQIVLAADASFNRPATMAADLSGVWEYRFQYVAAIAGDGSPIYRQETIRINVDGSGAITGTAYDDPYTQGYNSGPSTTNPITGTSTASDPQSRIYTCAIEMVVGPCFAEMDGLNSRLVMMLKDGAAAKYYRFTGL